MPLLRRRGRPPKDVPVQAIDESLSLFRINLTGAARKYLRAARCTQCPEVELVHAARAEIWVGLRQGIEPTKDGIRASIGRAFRDVHSKHASAAHEHDVEKVAAVQPELPAPADVEQLDDEKYATRQLAAFIEEVDQDNIAVLLMAVCKYKGLPQTRISKIVGLSEGRVSQVLADLRTQLTGKRRRQLLKRLSAVLVGWRTNLADDVLVHASSLAAKPSIKKPGRSWTPLSTGLAVGGFLGALAVIGFLSFGQSPGPQQVDAAESGDPGPETPHEAVANPDTLRLATTSDSPEPKYREVTSFQEPEGKGFLRPADIAAIEGVVDTFAREYAKVPTTNTGVPT